MGPAGVSPAARIKERAGWNRLKENKVHIGGQAVIEGVMMRNRSKIAIAVRQPNGGIAVEKKNFFSFSERFPILKWPVLRGMVAFVEALVLGVRSISASAEHALEEEEELKGWELPLTVAVSLAFGVGLFILLPTVLMNWLRQSGGPALLLNLGEGAIRLVIFLSYIFLISRWKEIGRVFQYHGAEHKAIACYEAGLPLTVDNTRPYSPLHRRCGTSFLLIVMVTSILLFSFFGWPGIWQRILIRLSLLPLVAGLSYEAIKFAGARDNLLTRLISQPGLWLQRMTTRKPADDQIEVAIQALQAVLQGDEGIAGEEVAPRVKVESMEDVFAQTEEKS